MNYYILRTRPVEKIYWNGAHHELSPNLDNFIVEPIYKRKKIVAFKEILTNKIIAKRFNYINDFNSEDYIDYFINYNTLIRNTGDVSVKIIGKANEEFLNEYKKQTSEEISKKIDNLEKKAIKEYQKSIGLEFKNQPLDYYKKELYELKIKDDTTLLVYPEKRFGNIKYYRELTTGTRILRIINTDEGADIILGIKFLDFITNKYFEFDPYTLATRTLPTQTINQYINRKNPITFEQIQKTINNINNEIKESRKKAKILNKK